MAFCLDLALLVAALFRDTLVSGQKTARPIKQAGQTATSEEAGYRGSYHEARRYAKFWLAFFTGGVAWTVQLLLSYAFVPFVCGGSRLPFYIISGLAAVLTAWAMVASFRNWRKSRRGDPSVVGRHDEGVTPFMTYAGFVTNVAFFALILTTGAAILLLNPCRIR